MAESQAQRRFYQYLEPTAWPKKGLSPVNSALVVFILIGVAAGIAETEPYVATGRRDLFNGLELFLGGVFLVEYVARIWVAPLNPRFASSAYPRLRYMVSPIAIIDLLAILPVFLALAGGPSLVLRFFRVLRMLRLAKLGRTSQAWLHIRDAIVDRRHEFGLILVLLALAVLISASMLYWAEADAQPDKFGSIPRAIWWAIVTLTTVGYGDSYPVTVMGRAFAGVIAIIGVALVALPTGLFASSFTEAMQRHRERKGGSNR